MDREQYIPENQAYRQRVEESFSKQPFMHFINAQLTIVAPGHCEIELPYSKYLTQQHGFFHAGVVSTLADNAAGYAAFSLMASSSSVLTVEYKINLVAPAKGDWLAAKASVIKNGKTLKICQAEVFSGSKEDLKLCAMAQVTIMELRNRKDGPAKS